MTVRHLIELLSAFNPEAVVIPATGKFTRFVPAFTRVASALAVAKTKNDETRYLESTSGQTPVVVIE